MLAISETHDCKIDVTQAALHILAQWLLDKQGISIYRRSQAIPQAVSETCCGTYLMPSAIVKVAMQGGTAHFQETPLKAQAYPWETYLRYDGSRWIANEKVNYFFTEAQGDQYLMSEMNGQTYPVAMKAKSFKPLSDVWNQRLNQRYVVVNPSPEDLVIGEIMTASACRRCRTLRASWSRHSAAGRAATYTAAALTAALSRLMRIMAGVSCARRATAAVI